MFPSSLSGRTGQGSGSRGVGCPGPQPPHLIRRPARSPGSPAAARSPGQKHPGDCETNLDVSARLLGTRAAQPQPRPPPACSPGALPPTPRDAAVPPAAEALPPAAGGAAGGRKRGCPKPVRLQVGPRGWKTLRLRMAAALAPDGLRRARSVGWGAAGGLLSRKAKVVSP